MHVITLPQSALSTSTDYKVVEATPGTEGGDVPEKRVGHTAAAIGERIFIWGGRGGVDMKPLQESGRVWVFDIRSEKWTFLDPAPGSEWPEARSYHASVAVEIPGPKLLRA